MIIRFINRKGDIINLRTKYPDTVDIVNALDVHDYQIMDISLEPGRKEISYALLRVYLRSCRLLAQHKAKHKWISTSVSRL